MAADTQSGKRRGGGRRAADWRFSCGWLALLMVLPGTACGSVLLAPAVNPESHVEIHLESWLDALPYHGFVPVRVTIRNGSGEAHTWTITSGNSFAAGGGASLTSQLTVEAGGTAERMIYAPVTAETGRRYYYGALAFTVSGYGVDSSSAGSVDAPSNYSTNRTAYVGMSHKVARNHWTPLREALSKSRPGSGSSVSDLCGSEVDMDQAPPDWRGFSGLAQLWVDESEWISLRPESKAALMDWISLGGRVYVLARDGSEARAAALGIPPKSGDVRRHGAGSVVLMTWNGANVPLPEMTREARSDDSSGLRTRLGEYTTGWGLRRLAGDLSLRSGLIFGFIAIFGILIGPVNLFWLAPAGRRQKLFWTTPLLSLGGSAILLCIMVLQDGVGGSGARLTLAILRPEQKRLAIVQEQACRTGVLLGRSFAVSEPGWMQPLRIENPLLSYPSYREVRYNYNESDTQRSGDWFSSRSVQAHVLEAVRPSRASVEVFAGEGGHAPSVLSNVETSLKLIYVVDESGAVWQAEDVGTGEKKQTRASSRAEFDRWLREGVRKEAGPVFGAAFDALVGQRGCVFAEAAQPSKLAIPTLSSVRWTDDHAIIAGPYIKH